jgi:hypothetical protein
VLDIVVCNRRGVFGVGGLGGGGSRERDYVCC